MHIVVTRSIFIDSFRSVRPTNFTYQGLNALFDYFDEMDEQDIELDVIAICCEFSQYTEEEAITAYGMTIEELEERTSVIRTGEDTIIVQDF